MLATARNLVKQYTTKQLYSTALYWADKALSLSQDDVNDLTAYVQALYNTGQYQRAAHKLKSTAALNYSPALKYLAAR